MLIDLGLAWQKVSQALRRLERAEEATEAMGKAAAAFQEAIELAPGPEDDADQSSTGMVQLCGSISGCNLKVSDRVGMTHPTKKHGQAELDRATYLRH